MSVVRWLLRRAAFAAASVYVVVSLAFCLVALFPVPSAPPPEPGSPRDPSTPLGERYVAWLVDVATLEWGQYGGEPIVAVLADALALTATYAAPAVLVAVPVGLVFGVHSALAAGGLLERVERYGAYLAFAVPTFFLGILLLDLLTWRLGWLHPFYDADRALLSAYNLLRLALPAAVLTCGIAAVQVRHARAAVGEHLPEDHVKLLRAQGGSRWLLGRRLVRQSAPSLVSQFGVELLGVVLPGVVAIEVIFGLPGFGRLLLVTALQRSQALVLGVTVVTVVLGVGGAVLADLVAVVVDPRVRAGDR